MHDQAEAIVIAADDSAIEKQVVDLISLRAEVSDESFESLSTEILSFQRRECPVYARFCESIGADQDSFPYLPIEAFRLAEVTTFPAAVAEERFVSSGTTASQRSTHLVKRRSLYDASILGGFRRFVSEKPTVIVAYLPGYIDGGSQSSLVYMARKLIALSGAPGSQVVGGDLEQLAAIAEHAHNERIPLVLLGAAFGLLSIAEGEGLKLPPNSTVIETGGMKTYRKSIGRFELHQTLSAGFQLDRHRILSEYGMTELLSQAYSAGDEWYSAPPWMRVTIVDPLDPTRSLPDGTEGAIAIIDLANLYTVSAIVTQDRGVASGSRFQILGRLESAELRGCNFLFE